MFAEVILEQQDGIAVKRGQILQRGNRLGWRR
jgi:hypothetical protein